MATCGDSNGDGSGTAYACTSGQFPEGGEATSVRKADATTRRAASTTRGAATAATAGYMRRL